MRSLSLLGLCNVTVTRVTRHTLYTLYTLSHQPHSPAGGLTGEKSKACLFKSPDMFQVKVELAFEGIDTFYLNHTIRKPIPIFHHPISKMVFPHIQSNSSLKK